MAVHLIIVVADMVIDDISAVVNAYSLIRFSTDRQTFGSSFHRQVERVRAECARRGWVFNEKLCLRDLGVSAFRANNFKAKFALGKFIEAARKGLLLPNPVLIIENPDRFSRAEMHQADAQLWELIEECGVKILFLSLGGDPLTKGDASKFARRAVPMIEFERAHNESKRKSELATGSVDKRLHDATDGKKVSLGRWQPRWIDFVGGEFRLNSAAAVVRRIVDAYLSGDSTGKIACDLNKDKVKPLRNGKFWTHSLVVYFLRTEHLLGHKTIKGKRLEAYYPAVVTLDEWKKLQVKLSNNQVRHGGSELVPNLFRNRCHCAACGGYVGAARSELRDGVTICYYYRCNNARCGKCQVRKMIPVSILEQDFFGAYLLEDPLGLMSKQDVDQQRRIEGIQFRMAGLDQQIKDTMELIGEVQVSELKGKLKKLQGLRDAERKAMEGEIQRAAANQSVAGGVSSLRTALHMADAEESVQAYVALEAAVSRMREQLKDNETRRKLRDLLPEVVTGIVIDLQQFRYAVQLLSGEMSSWRDLTAYAAALRRLSGVRGKRPGLLAENTGALL